MSRDTVSIRTFLTTLILLTVVGSAGTPALAQWVTFTDETGARLSADPGVGSNDPEEKDYAWGDVDRDFDIDLVIVRKEPFTSPGKKTNVLLLNEGGVLVDRTDQYATASDVPGDNGFKTPTNDRDIQLVDVNGDNWLDMVTAVTLSDGDPTHIGHPRIYINLGNDGGGNWRGFRYESARIPTMLSASGQGGFNPRFCSVSVGDLTGDNRPELFFGDYDSSGAGGFGQPSGADFDDRLLINDGTGFFSDETTSRFSGLVSIPGSSDAPFYVSAFGAANAIRDMNGDGFTDIVKQTSLNSPLYVGIAYNKPDDEGFFDTYDVVNNLAPYFVSVGDLNRDGKLDLVITDDGQDRYMINQGNDGNGVVQWFDRAFTYQDGGDDSFGSNSLIVDLNNDSWNDVLIADVDVDISGCGRRMHIFRNLGGQPGDNVTLQEQNTGTGCTTQNNPSSCFVASIPADKLEGVHDVAVFDINGDGFKDMVVGRCSTTEVYMNTPPSGLIFSYPVGLPFFIEPGVSANFQVRVTGFGGGIPIAGQAKMFVSINEGIFVETPMTHVGGNIYDAAITAPPQCSDRIAFYFSAEAVGGGMFFDPSDAPAGNYDAVSAIGSVTLIDDGFEGDVSSWTVVNDPSLSSGAWEQADPNGTVSGGQQAAPDEDADGAQDQILAFVTQNGPPGGDPGVADVDGGPTDLISPPINLLDTDATITYSRWHFSSGEDVLEVSVSADGTNWVTVETVGSSENSWTTTSFQVGDFVTPSATVQVRFRTADNPNNDVTESGVDRFRVETFVCPTCTVDPQCDDGNFCNGIEQCIDEVCTPGSGPCPGSFCDEGLGTCVDCLVHAHCIDGDFCDGNEICLNNSCVTGFPPCAGQLCDESNNVCADCLVDNDCDDGLFCNGAESCIGSTCQSGGEPCASMTCDETNDVCLGTIQLQPKMGEPLAGLTAPQLERFELGREAFNRVFTAPEGLGPIFNQNSCGVCHSQPVGGSSGINVTRFGFNDPKGSGFDPLGHLGGSLLQREAFDPSCEEDIPPEANVLALRVTPSTLGFGLLEAIPDGQILAIANNPPAGVSGRAHLVAPLEDPGLLKVGRFGWKAQVATVLTFSGDALLNEMGITNRLVGTENAPNGDQALLAICDTVPDPEDGPDSEGFHFIDRVTDFQRFLAPPPQTPRSGMTGETMFNNAGCNSCHASSFTTDVGAELEDSIRDKTVSPYSDFLLHDMGLAADFIEQGAAGVSELRTPPLWGLRVRDPMWHDGRVVGESFEDRMRGAILEHNALNSEGQASAQDFALLSSVEQDQLIQFLDSLGRAEFDADGDGDVDLDDYADLLNCFSGPGNFYTPDDPCAIHDPDQDGDVDDDDVTNFNVATDVQSGGISTQLILGRDAQLDEVSLSWGSSCLTNDADFGVYQGTIGDFATHGATQCSTSGATTTSFATPAGDVYFLVVPNNDLREGSYGQDSEGVERPQGTGACRVQSAVSCQ